MIILLALLPPASAQDGGFDAHGFRLATADPDLRDPLTFVRPGAQETLDWYAGGAVEYATRPLVFEPDPAGERIVALRDLIATNLAAGVVVFDPVRLDVAVPVYLSSTGVDGAQAAGLGDIHLGVGAIFVQPDDGGLGLGLLAALDVPAGDRGAWLGEGGIAGDLGLTGSLEADELTASWRVGGRFTPSSDPATRPSVTRGGDTVEGALAFGWLANEQVGVSAEAHLSVPVDGVVRTAIGVPAEAILSGRYVLEGGGHVMGGVGIGLGQGAGASPIRLLVGGGFGTSGGPPSDIDGDGLVDAIDACIEEAETVNGFKDDDGCADELPILEIVAEVEGAEAPDALLTITDGEGAVLESTGRATVQGLPGLPYTAVARQGTCHVGRAEGRIPADGTAELRVPISLATGTVVVTVTDAAGRPLEGTTIRYLVDAPECAPGADMTTVAGGKGVDTMGIGTHTVLVTAPGYDIHQEQFTLEAGGKHLVTAELSPTQVRIEGSRVVLAAPVTWAEGKSELSESALPVLSQVASTLIVAGVPRVEVRAHPDARGGGRTLAKARADAVVKYLETLGVEPGVLEAVGDSAAARGPSQLDLSFPTP